jgi:hypothetical protein
MLYKGEVLSMKANKKLSFLLTLMLVIYSLCGNLVNAAPTSSVEIVLDKTNASVGEIVTASINVNNVDYFSGLQVNLKYDPEVLQPVTSSGNAYTNSTMPEAGTIINNEEFNPHTVVGNIVDKGILNFGKFYLGLADYKAAASPEKSGTVAVIKFKVLKSEPTSISFQDTEALKNANNGTVLFDWNGDKITSAYNVGQAQLLNFDEKETSYIAMDFDKSTAEVGDIITATVKVNKIANFAGYQVNIKYDPTVLQAVNPNTGSAYGNKTRPTSGELLTELDYGPLGQVDNKVTEGILNFAICYQELELYRESGTAKDTGSIAIIGFKVLQKKPTSVVFEDTETMPNGITGTTLFDWDGNRIGSGYSVIQPKEINSVSITPTATVAPTATATAKVTATPVPTATVTVAPTATATAKVTATPVPTATVTVAPTATATAKVTATPVPTATVTVAPTATATAKVTATPVPTATVTVAPTATATAKVTATPVPTATVTVAPTATATAKVTPTPVPTVTVTVAPTTTATATPVPTATPTTDDSYITIDLDKTDVSVGETIKATVRINNIKNFSGYQLNIKYDPTVLQAVDVGSGVPYTNSTKPQAGDLLLKAYGPFDLIANKINDGILNIGKMYTQLENYRDSNDPEETGSLFVVGFKVLQAKDTTIVFEDCEEMPNGIIGTMLFNWEGDQILTGYSVIQPSKITISPEETPEFIYGDVDGNGYIWINDYVIIRDYVLGKIDRFTPKYGNLAADVDGDGKILSNDAILVRDYVLGKINSFPAEEKK